MKLLITLLFLLCSFESFGQASNPNDTLKIGSANSFNPKGLIFNTGDGNNNVNLLVDDSRNTGFSGNSFQLGDGSGGDKCYRFSNSESVNPSLCVDHGNTDLKYNKDTITFGNGDATNDKFIIFNNGQTEPPAIKLDGNTDRLFFRSPAGTPFKEFGTGSGGGGSGVNLLGNPGFENLGTGWSIVGQGTATYPATTHSREGNLRHLSLIFNNANTVFRSNPFTVSEDVLENCEVSGLVRRITDKFRFKIRQLPGNTLIVNQEITGNSNSTWTTIPVTTFACTAGTQYFVEIAANPGISSTDSIELDSLYVGSIQNITPIQNRAHFVGSLTWPYALNSPCTWQSTVFGSGFQNYANETNCGLAPRVIEGDSIVDSSLGLRPEVQISNARAGTYYIVFSGDIMNSNTSTTAHIGMNISSETNYAAVNFQKIGTSTTTPALIFKYTTSMAHTNLTFTMARDSTASNDPSFTPSRVAVSFQIYYYPSDDDTNRDAYNPEITEEFTSARFDTSPDTLNPPDEGIEVATANANKSIRVLADSNLSIIRRIGQALPTCASGAETFAGNEGYCASNNEQLGMDVIVNVAGTYEVCFSANTISLFATTDRHYIADYFISRTAVNSTTSLDRSIGHRQEYQRGQQSRTYNTLNFCSAMNIPAGRHSFKVEAQTVMSNLTVGLTQNVFILHDSASMSLKRLTPYIKAPVLVDSVTTSGNKQLRTEACQVTQTAGITHPLCTSWISSATVESSGTYNLTLRSGIFSAAPICTASPKPPDGAPTSRRIVTIRQNTTSLISVVARQGGNVANTQAPTPFNLICVGSRS